MIDNFALALTHGLMMLAAWRLLMRVDLDAEAPPKAVEQRKHWGKQDGTRQGDA